MKPSSLSTRQISALTPEAGMSTVVWWARTALRTRERKSEMGSFIDMVVVLYQLDFVTPGSLPSSARVRKQMRHIWNLRRKPRGRPQRLQRLYLRTLNFGSALHRLTWDVFATVLILA